MQIFRCRLDPLNGESNKTECKDALRSFSRALGGGYFLTILVRLLPLLGAGIDDTSLPLQSLLSDRWELFKSSLVDKGMVIHWPRGPMDKASAYGAGDCRFESCRGQAKSMRNNHQNNYTIHPHSYPRLRGVLVHICDFCDILKGPRFL